MKMTGGQAVVEVLDAWGWDFETVKENLEPLIVGRATWLVLSADREALFPHLSRFLKSLP